jgi:hypothetical protein
MLALDVSPSTRPFAVTRPRPWSSKRWCDYFQRQHQARLAIPWERGAELTASDRDLIGPSLQVFQQGEAQEGGHFYRCARAYAETSGDLAYAVAHRLFMDEEKRHGGDLARFLALADIPILTERSWLTQAFCWCGSRGGLELTLLVIVMSEIVARIYYAALRRATASTILRGLCAQILRDEKQHVRFQSERLAILRRDRPAELLVLTHALDVLLFVGAALVCWCGHHRVLQAGGFELGHFWCEAWRAFCAAARQKDPRNYAWR